MNKPQGIKVPITWTIGPGGGGLKDGQEDPRTGWGSFYCGEHDQKRA